jgi:hypothetical protein
MGHGAFFVAPLHPVSALSALFFSASGGRDRSYRRRVLCLWVGLPLCATICALAARAGGACAVQTYRPLALTQISAELARVRRDRFRRHSALLRPGPHLRLCACRRAPHRAGPCFLRTRSRQPSWLWSTSHHLCYLHPAAAASLSCARYMLTERPPSPCVVRLWPSATLASKLVLGLQALRALDSSFLIVPA